VCLNIEKRKKNQCNNKDIKNELVGGPSWTHERALSWITLIIWAVARQFLASTLVRVTLCSVLQRQSNPQVSPPSRRGAPRRLAADQVVCARPMGIHTRDAYVHPREPIIEKSRRPNVSAWPFYRTRWLHCIDQNGPQMGYKSPLGVNRWAVPDG